MTLDSITVKSIFFTCPLFREFYKLGALLKILGHKILLIVLLLAVVVVIVLIQEAKKKTKMRVPKSFNSSRRHNYGFYNMLM